MTLKLTLGVPRSARVAKPEPEPEPEPIPDVEEEQVSEPLPAARRAAELDLALAMGTVAEPTAAPRTTIEDGLEDFAADELLVEELGMAMGAVIEPSAPPLDETDSLAEEHPTDSAPAEASDGSSRLAAGPPAGQLAISEGALDEAAPANVLTIPSSSWTPVRCVCTSARRSAQRTAWSSSRRRTPPRTARARSRPGSTALSWRSWASIRVASMRR